MGRLEGKTAIITGAGSGLGQAMALRFVAEGARVQAADIDEAGMGATVAALGDRATQAAWRRVDVTREDDCAAAVAEAMERWGRLDIMVANAGIGAPGSIANLALEDWQRVLDVDLTGVFLCAKHAFRSMRASGGSILATAGDALARRVRRRQGWRDPADADGGAGRRALQHSREHPLSRVDADTDGGSLYWRRAHPRRAGRRATGRLDPAGTYGHTERCRQRGPVSGLRRGSIHQRRCLPNRRRPHGW